MIQARIVEVMSFLKLTAVALAENIGVQPSSVSHILSGRNKPSLDFVNKLLNKYPQIDAQWLLNGRGSMLKSEMAPSNEGTLFSFSDSKDVIVEDSAANYASAHTLFDNASQSSKSANVDMSLEQTNGKPKETLRTRKKSKGEITSSSVESVAQKLSLEKKISRIVIFYSDNSFEEFLPKND